MSKQCHLLVLEQDNYVDLQTTWRTSEINKVLSKLASEHVTLMLVFSYWYVIWHNKLFMNAEIFWAFVLQLFFLGILMRLINCCVIIQLARHACLAGYIFCLCFFFYFLIFFIFFVGRPLSKLISGTTERIFTNISGLIDLCKCLINPAFIWRSLKGCCNSNKLKSQNQLFHRKISLSCCRSKMDQNIGTPMGTLEAH